MSELRTVDGSATIRLSGEIDMTSVDAIARQVQVALGGGPAELILDMEDVSFIDSTGIGAMVSARNACIQAGSRLSIADPSPAVLRVLRITGLHRVMGFRTPGGSASAL